MKQIESNTTHTGTHTRKIQPSQINVLIACEESQAECMAFREAGFNAFSCDIKECRKGTPGSFHIVDDVTPYLKGKTAFHTQDGTYRQVPRWHLIIAHPPCTYLCKVSSPWMVQGGQLNEERYAKMLEARDFFYKCLGASAPFVAVENPLPMARANLPKPSCFVHPSWYGHKYTKKTLYWLRNLPPLMPQIIFPNPKEFVRASRGHYRSRTFPGVAKAMAEQWGNYILDEMNKLTHHRCKSSQSFKGTTTKKSSIKTKVQL